MDRRGDAVFKMCLINLPIKSGGQSDICGINNARLLQKKFLFEKIFPQGTVCKGIGDLNKLIGFESFIKGFLVQNMDNPSSDIFWTV